MPDYFAEEDYAEGQRRLQENPPWDECEACQGSGIQSGCKCGSCGGLGLEPRPIDYMAGLLAREEAGTVETQT